MIYGYARCSTNEDKQDIQRQVRKLKQAGAEQVFLEYEHGDSVYLMSSPKRNHAQKTQSRFTQKQIMLFYTKHNSRGDMMLIYYLF